MQSRAFFHTLTLPFSVLALLSCLALPASAAQTLRNLVSVEGVRENPLVGYGLVVGLNGSGDSTQVKFASQSVVNMLKQFGVKLPDGAEAKNKNVAAVMVSAVFPPGYRRGQPIDVTVSSLGDSKSLRGGVLLLTQLRAADNEVYALAQGNVVVGGLNATGASGSSVTVNTPTGGRIPNGANIEREIGSDFSTRAEVMLRLKNPHFQTATNVVEAINRRFGPLATTADGASIEVIAPANPTERVAFMAKLQAISVDVGTDTPKVVFNSRTGTVVIAEGVRVKAAAVTHGSLKVVIAESSNVSQPGPFSGGRTAVTPQSKLSVDQGSGAMFKWPAGAKLQTIVDIVNSLGASPDDIMAILQALDQAGAIEGELVVI
ncbi:MULTISPECIES: flagellar basal body P-ring protein FlgI [Massilia]|uniref:Flagellar P-ring protein n=2 Tax=Massilia TaxID=149698 RepID=A0ABY3ZYI7_9BURK|nr:MULTISPECIES: flagellar basal body P-ring protein FlgI [Massilia]NHZ40022.1 flagellar basal body P-ring protein FlgI [Massilia aquatica]UOD27529.1 flagellar basal body P-ring protein FlgI [Massilia violaceinigra]